MAETGDILVVGGGIFGITGALELRRRGHSVTLIDPGPLPHPLAESTDISKVVRMEYGSDALYMELGEKSREGWLRWNDDLGEQLYYDVGVFVPTRRPMQPGEYEHQSYQLLLKRGHRPERLTADEIIRRFPAWTPGLYSDGFFNAEGGYVLSGRAVARLVEIARREGVTIHEGQTADHLIEQGGRILGVQTREGSQFHAGHVLIAAGAWTGLLVPELAGIFTTPGMPVFHLKPADPRQFEVPQFTVFIGDIANTGWYGFPLHPREGVVKLGHHGIGQMLHPEKDARLVGDSDERSLREFLRETLPGLAEAEIVYTRRCLYCDTPDSNFWIDRHPGRDGLSVAAGGSGHGFKFGPVLGGIIADAVEVRPNPYLPRFQWREAGPAHSGEGDASRSHVLPGQTA
jgi:glycine/D-amino acid oxidase-like deaminating enzyme